MTSILETFFKTVILPELIKSAVAKFALLGVALNLPILGPGITLVINYFIDEIISRGIVDLKVAMIDWLSDEAKIQYAPQIQILRDAQSQETLTPEQDAEYAEKLQELVRNHPGVVKL